MKFYYTFGSSRTYPYFGGWVEVDACCRQMADKAFRKEYPDRVPDTLNCACVYAKNEFEMTGFRDHGNMGEFCHRKLKASDALGKKSPVDSDDVLEFVGQIIDIFEDFLEGKGIQIDNPEKESQDDPAIIYGSDYGDLSDDLKNLLAAWKIIDKEGAAC